jgi:anti-sigma-K factor RskA
MAELVIEGDDLWVRMRRGEAFWAFHRPFRVPLSSVRAVRTPESAWKELRGWRSTGVTFTGKVALGTRRHGGGYDFVALHGHEPAVVIELNGMQFGEIVVSVPDAEATAQHIADAAGITR